MYATRNRTRTRKQTTIAAKIADAVTALHAADAKIALALKDFADTHDMFSDLTFGDLLEAQMNARLFGRLLNTGSTPALPGRLFRSILDHENRNPVNDDHVEGVVLALGVAKAALTEALEMAGQLDAETIDPAYEVAYAARGAIGSYFSLLDCNIVTLLDGGWRYRMNDFLDELARGKPRLALVGAA